MGEPSLPSHPNLYTAKEWRKGGVEGGRSGVSGKHTGAVDMNNQTPFFLFATSTIE